MRLLRTPLLAVLVVCTAGCATTGPFVRIATASRAELEEATKKEVSWFEFQKGDEVPFQLFFFGALQGGASKPLRATRPLYMRMSKQDPIMFSLQPDSGWTSTMSKTLISVVPNDDGHGGTVAWMSYVGDSQNPQGELEKLLEATRE